MTHPSLAMISQEEFALFRDLMYKVAGVCFSESKRHLVSGRLARRIRECELPDFGAYYRLVTSEYGKEEFHRMIDLLTTHETYFFREPKHFEFLAQHVIPQRLKAKGERETLRVWSAASSTGEEPYTLAMVLMELLGDKHPWEIVATDISRESLSRAQSGVYTTSRLDGLPTGFLRKYFLKGTGSREGTVRIVPELRHKVSFREANLTSSLGSLGEFDVAFLRNVLIYFDMQTKQGVVNRVVQQIRKEGWLFIGHSESLNGLTTSMQQEKPTVYRKQSK
ncbi:MAG: protein-glutamate O-methyltransferase CheR [Hahellaceae bacterium]|nr:protein-glutamate O-methyltransferase CheR [Hahellaceae bacterium]MCP5168385.1 protein-glutamate O-methyltransferase CheR [Hahellaceae bacterium]